MNQLKDFLRKIIRLFITGLIVLLPLGATLILLGWLLNFMDQLIGGQSVFATIWQTAFGWLALGKTASLILGYIVLATVIIVVGYFAQGYAQQRIGAALRRFFDKIPIINKIYGSVAQVIELWSKKKEGEESQKFGEVVMVNFSNVKVFGVLSSRNKYRMKGEDYFLVYLPSAPVPATGFTYFIKCDEVFSCELKMDDMTKVVVSLGVLGQDVLGEEIDLKAVPAMDPEAKNIAAGTTESTVSQTHEDSEKA